MLIETKIKCNGIKPSKAEVYTLAAELVETAELNHFYTAIIEALSCYDYGYDYDYDNYYDNYNYTSLSTQEKVIALLFLAAVYSTPEEKL